LLFPSLTPGGPDSKLSWRTSPAFTRLRRQLGITRDRVSFHSLRKSGRSWNKHASLRARRCSVIVTSNLPFDEWTSVFGSERLTGALLDRLTHHVHILEMNGPSYRLRQSEHRRRSPSSDARHQQPG
jgi:hypothetical protein